MPTLRHFDDVSLRAGIEVKLWDWVQNTAHLISLRLFDENGRQRLEMNPVFVPAGQAGGYQKILEKVLQIVADPQNIRPERPVGHVHAEHTQPTTRWSDIELTSQLSNLETNPNWVQYRDDGGSTYFNLDVDGKTYTKQVTRSGRVLIGQVEEVSLPVEWGERDVFVMFKIVRRLVVKAGTEGRSSVGATNFDFVGFELNS